MGIKFEFSIEKIYLLLSMLFLVVFPSFSSDTLIISNFENQNSDLSTYFYTYIDSTNKITAKNLLHKNFTKSKVEQGISFGFNKNNCWIKFSIYHKSLEKKSLILVVSNPDINYLDYYVFENSTLINEIHTGELRDKNSKTLPHRFFLFQLDLKPNSTYTYLICSNNEGDTNLVPISIKKTETFYKEDLRDHFFYAIIYGIFIFIFGFNYYLYKIVKDKIYLYYLMYVFFCTAFFLSYDGYFYYIGWKWLSNMGRILFPTFAIVFFIAFSQKFLDSSIKFSILNQTLTGIKAIMIIVGILPIINFSYFVSTFVIGVTLIFSFSFLIFIFYAFKFYNKKYIPSQYFLLAFIVMVIFTVIYPLKEIGLLPYNFFTVNSVRFAFSFQCILLTIAVLERFRINQENSKKKIEENLSQIEFQNKELEIINSELEKLSVVASETNNSVAICDKDGRIEWCNVGFEKFYDISLDELIKEQKDYLKSIIPNPDILKLIRDCADTKKPVSFETLITTQRKKEIWVQTTLTPYVRQGEIQKIIAIDSDITNLKLVEKKLQSAMERAVESDRLKTVFLGNMSHEIRTPLNGILGFSELLSEKNIPEEKKNRYLEIIRSNGDQLVRIIDDIVDISLIESNQLRVYFTEFDLSKFYSDLIEFFENFKSSVDKSYIQLIPDFRINPDECIISSDMMRLKQVSMNLLKNAFKFTEKGEVKFGCYIENENVIFYVQDTGIGVDVVKKGIIFDRFRQGDESMTRRFGGNGLGLTISKGIIENLNGKIWVDQNYSDGFLIYFSVPVQQSKEKTAKKSLTQKNA